MNSVRREVAMHPGIDGTVHHHGHLHWWPPDCLWDSEYARPECPATHLASADGPVGCSIICKRVTDDGFGGWYCRHHGVFFVFGYPRDGATETMQATFGGEAVAR